MRWSIVRSWSRGHISKTKQDRLVTQLQARLVNYTGTADHVEVFRSSLDTPWAIFWLQSDENMFKY